MLPSFQLPKHLDSIKQHRGWFTLLGICLTLFGLYAIAASVFTTIVSIIFIGTLFFIAGIFMLIDTFKFWLHKGISFFIHLLLSIFYMIFGTVLFLSPLVGAISLTFFLGIFFIVIGIYRSFYALSLKLPKWGWILFNGIITTILGILVLSQWPISGLYAIGLFVGIDITLIGWTYIMLAIFSNDLVKKS